jgi:hypothetical protein
LLSCAPPWTVVTQASPNVLAGQKSFVLEPIDFGDLETEAEHRSAITAAYPSALQKQARDFSFQRSGSSGDFTIRTEITRLEKGLSLGLQSTDSEIDIRVQILQEEIVLDEITLTGEANQDDAPTVGGIPLGGYGDTDRLTDAAAKLGRYVGRYLTKRTK